MSENSNVDILMENNDDFECLVIKKGKISHISWTEPDYLQKLMDLDLIESVKTNSKTFAKFLADSLQVQEYQVKSLYVKPEIITEEKEYVYELYYIDLEKEVNYHKDDYKNELASLVNVNGETIYSNAIFMKNYLPSLSEKMSLSTVTKDDLKRVMHNRVHTKVITYDEINKWVEREVVGDLTIFANQFFDNDYKKVEMPFLMHNLNIWFTTEYETDNWFGSKDKVYDGICGRLINKPIEKCILFTMITDECRGNITMDEVKKIIYLSTKLETYRTPEIYVEERMDEMGRKIIYNKYRVLDDVYSKNS